MSKKYISKKMDLKGGIPEPDKQEAIKLLIKSGMPMLLKYINGENVVFVMDIPLSGENETRIKGIAMIPFEKRDFFKTEIHCETTYVYPSKLDPDWITVKYSRFNGNLYL